MRGLIEQSRRESRGRPEEAAVDSAPGCFVDDVERLPYGTFRRPGLLIGSGVVEAGCNTVIGARGKQSGRRWSEPGAENMLARRCIHRSRRTTESRQRRPVLHAARNDSLALPVNEDFCPPPLVAWGQCPVAPLPAPVKVITLPGRPEHGSVPLDYSL